MKADIIWDEGTTKVVLLEPVEVAGWTVPVGFASDGGSIPRPLWSWCNPLDGRFIKIFSFHDFCYSQGIDRAWADRTLRDQLILAGMRRTQAYAIYYAVRAFGGRHYRRE